MNYWTHYIFKDGSLIHKIAIPGIGFLLLIDILSYIANYPGYFHLWPLKIVAVIGIPFIIKIIYKNFHTLNKTKKMKIEAPIFEKKRENEIMEILKTNPDYTTFCYECIYFNEGKRSCSRDRIFERVKEIHVGKRQFCLYWKKKVETPGSPGY